MSPHLFPTIVGFHYWLLPLWELYLRLILCIGLIAQIFFAYGIGTYFGLSHFVVGVLFIFFSRPSISIFFAILIIPTASFLFEPNFYETMTWDIEHMLDIEHYNGNVDRKKNVTHKVTFNNKYSTSPNTSMTLWTFGTKPLASTYKTCSIIPKFWDWPLGIACTLVPNCWGGRDKAIVHTI